MTTEPTITTSYRIIRCNGETEDRTIEWPAEPGFRAIAALIRPILDGADPEHVAVLYQGKRRDMFVDEIGLVKGLPRNNIATAIYRNNWLTRHPGTEPESLNFIAGTAVLFPDRIIWS